MNYQALAASSVVFSHDTLAMDASASSSDPTLLTLPGAYAHRFSTIAKPINPQQPFLKRRVQRCHMHKPSEPVANLVYSNCAVSGQVASLGLDARGPGDVSAVVKPGRADRAHAAGCQRPPESRLHRHDIAELVKRCRCKLLGLWQRCSQRQCRAGRDGDRIRGLIDSYVHGAGCGLAVWAGNGCRKRVSSCRAEGRS
jgi:hypothetical protein